MNTPRPIREIAADVRADMIAQHGRNYLDKFPYCQQQLEAMFSLDKITDNFHQDSGAGVVGSFLCNVTTWRGENARRLKKELNAILQSR